MPADRKRQRPFLFERLSRSSKFQVLTSGFNYKNELGRMVQSASWKANYLLSFLIIFAI